MHVWQPMRHCVKVNSNSNAARYHTQHFAKVIKGEKLVLIPTRNEDTNEYDPAELNKCRYTYQLSRIPSEKRRTVLFVGPKYHKLFDDNQKIALHFRDCKLSATVPDSVQIRFKEVVKLHFPLSSCSTGFASSPGANR